MMPQQGLIHQVFDEETAVITRLLVQNLNAETTLQTKEFFIIAVNVHNFSTEELTPCELALTKFCLRDGVMGTYSKLLDFCPNTRDENALKAAKTKSRTSHRIPVPTGCIGDKSATRVWQEMVNFLTNESALTEKTALPLVMLPALFATSIKNIAVAKKCIQAIWDSCQFDAALIMKPVSVLQIDCLVSRILERTESCLKNPQDSAKLQFFLKNPSAVSEVFDRDDYFEVPDLACGYHKRIICPQHCARHVSVRCGYYILELVCFSLGITPRRGQHFPNHLIWDGQLFAPFWKDEPQQSTLARVPITVEEDITLPAQLAKSDKCIPTSTVLSANVAALPEQAQRYDPLPQPLQLTGPQQHQQPPHHENRSRPVKPTKILADAKASSVLSIEEEQTLKLNVKHFYKKKRIRQKAAKAAKKRRLREMADDGQSKDSASPAQQQCSSHRADEPN